MGLNMKEKQAVTREYKPRYQKAKKKEKNTLPDEFTRLTGCHRKSAIRLLSVRPVREVIVCIDGKPVKVKPEKKRPANRKGKRVCPDGVIARLRPVRTFFRYKCGKTLAPLMRRQMRYISRRPAFGVNSETAEKLKKISPVTIDRYLKKDKESLRLKGKSLTKPLSSLKSRIPIRTFYTGEERKKPGFWQTDTVRHCGQTVSGQHLHTLTATDIASGRIELRSPLNNARKRTFEALSDIKNTTPLPILEFHPDNGSEFINNAAEARCKKEGILFTGSGDGRKNDNRFVERKNGAVVREYTGYDRLEGHEEQALPANICKHLVPLLNFFMPTQKLKSKTGIGSKEIKSCDEPRSPFRRLIESAGLSQEIKNILQKQISLYNPVELQHNVNKAILRLRHRLAQANRKNDREQL
jgi:hypothetical protein